MKHRTISTMDAAGRTRDGRVEIGPLAQDVRLVRKGGILVAVPVEASEPLRSDTVREMTNSLRNRQR